MRMLTTLVLAVIAHSPATAAAQGGPMSVEIVPGGSVVTNLGWGDRINNGSSLQRSWVVLNDERAPAKLTGAGVKSDLANSDYHFLGAGTLTPTAEAVAYEVRFALYDAFGNHIKTLSGFRMTDVEVGGSLDLSTMRWSAWENEVRELLTVVAFLAYVRKADGTVWRYDSEAVERELASIQLQTTDGVLDPERPTP